MERSAYEARIDSPGTRTATRALIGPNAVIQTLAALEAQASDPLREQVLRSAGLPDARLDAMIPESWFVRLVAAARDTLPPAEADAVLRSAGVRTAEYVAANRIPAVFRRLLRLLPARMAIPLLLAAFSRHAWTFAGQSEFAVDGGYPGSILLSDAPTCRRTGIDGRTGAYYEAAFQGLLSLASAGVKVTEVECRSQGDPHCRYQITPEKRQNRG